MSVIIMIEPNISVIYRNFLRVNFLPLITDISLCTKFVNYVRNGFITRAPGGMRGRGERGKARPTHHFFTNKDFSNVSVKLLLDLVTELKL
jgi:hypothetical protein